MKKLLVVDGNSIINRAFYGIRLLSNKKGIYTNAIFGMINIIMRQVEALHPDCVAVAFDLKAPTFRHKMYGEYKAGRRGMPEELAMQFPYAKRVLYEMGFCVLECEGYEADDILGTLAARAEGEGAEAYILTGDRDSLQLISDTTTVLLATNNDTLKMDRSAFFEKYMIQPEQFVDLKALMGDSSDNIPGVAGIGEKTAIKLISEFGSLDALYESIPSDTLTPSVNKKLEASKENAFMSRELARICRDAPIGVGMDDLTYEGFRDGAYDLFLELELSSFIKKYNLSPTNDKYIEKANKTDENVGLSYENSDAETIEEQVGLFSHINSDKPISIVFENVKINEILALPKTEPCAISFENGELYCSCGDGDGNINRNMRFVGDLREARDFLCDRERTLILYDCKSAYHRLSDIGFESCAFDVMLAAYVLNAGDGHFDLPRLAISYLSRTLNDGEPTSPMILELYRTLKERLREQRVENIMYDIEMPLATVLYKMERDGFTIDREGLVAYGEQLNTMISSFESEIYAQAGKKFNINSTKQLGEVLFDTLGLPHGKKTKTGYSTNADVLDKLRASHPIIQNILDYRQVVKLKSTYVDGFLKLLPENNRIHTTFKQTGTATGRLSSAEPNLQNIPIRTPLGRELRHYFIPRNSDCALVDADYSQIELRLLAAISGDENMIGAFLSGVDIHTSTAASVFHVPESEVTSELRKRAKAVNFGIVYGIGEFSLSDDLHISMAEAKEYIASYKASYPLVDMYLRDIVAEGYANGYVSTLYGRRRYIPELAGQNKTLKKFGERVAMNSPIQGTAADIIKVAMINVSRRLEHEGIDARLILQVHDELVIEAHKSCADRASVILREEMENAISLPVPLSVELTVGDTWYDNK